MRKITMPLALAVLLLATAFIAIGVAWGQGSGPQIVNHETQGDSVREITAPPDSRSTRSAQHRLHRFTQRHLLPARPTQNICYVSWYYLSVNASPNYMITMTAFLNDFGPVAHTQGFFQTSMYVPYNMLGQGVKVACGSSRRGRRSAIGQSLRLYHSGAGFGQPGFSELRDGVLPALHALARGV